MVPRSLGLTSRRAIPRAEVSPLDISMVVQKFSGGCQVH
jgi:hypothetical protein